MITELLPGEDDVPGEHAGDAGDLLLLVHPVVGGNIGLEIKGNLPGHSGQYGQQVSRMRLSLNDMAQRLRRT